VDTVQFGPQPILEDDQGNNLGFGQDIDAATNWYTFADPTVHNSDSVPYATILGSGNGSWDIYTFYVDSASPESPIHVVMDIDNGNYLDKGSFIRRMVIELADQDGKILNDATVGEATTYGLLPTPVESLDPGSWSKYDPLLEWDITEPGTYRVGVGSYRDYLVGMDWPSSGVAGAISYRLNVSVPEHATNPDVLDLVDKTVKIVSGKGVGQMATITGYDPTQRQFTIAPGWAAAPDATSKIQIGSAVNIDPVDDRYELVLTNKPASDVVIDVVPRPTRTYNSELAFDPDANYGQNEAVQVMTATPRARILLSGQVTAGEVWAVILDGTEFSYTAASGNTLATIASQLRYGINGQTVNGITFTGTIDASNNKAIIISASNNQTFYAAFAITPDSPGGVEITGTHPDTWAVANVELTGDVAPGETWTLMLDGTAYEYTSVDDDTLASVAERLRIASTVSGSPFTVSRTGRVLAVAWNDGVAFTASLTISPDTQGRGTITPQLVFTPDNWSTPQTATNIASSTNSRLSTT